VLEEVRRVVLGFDANPARSESLVALLEAPIPEDVSKGFLEQMSKIRYALASFVDTEEMFITAPRASVWLTGLLQVSTLAHAATVAASV